MSIVMSIVNSVRMQTKRVQSMRSGRHYFPALLLVFLLAGGNAWAETADFTLPGLDGKPHKLSDYRGKWVVVNFWATWCPPCLAEIPELVNFHEDHQHKDAVVLGINFEDIDYETLKIFVDDYFINYPVLQEKPGAKSVLGDIPGLPTTFIISPKGEIVARQVGSVTAELIEDFISGQKQGQFNQRVSRQ